MSHALLAERLQRRIGLDPASIGEITLHHAIDEACAELGARDPAELLARVDATEDDWQRFVDCMVVPETWLFRVPEQFDDLLRHARDLPATRRPLRVLSLPCASGEEVWSIAATLAGGGFAPGTFEVLGIDVSARAIEQARAARYRRSALRGRECDPAWFHGEGEHLSPVATLQRSARFRRGNVLQPGLFGPDESFDIVFCRNLLIYLDESARRKLLDSLLAVLEPDGIILSGQAELLSAIDSRLRPMPGLGPLCFGRARPLAAATATASATPHRTPAAATSWRRPDRAAPAPDAVNPPDLLTLARQLADTGELERARETCLALLARTPESAPGWFLLGTIETACGALDEAEQAWTRASFLDRDHREALLHRAALAERRGRPGEAAQLRSRLLRMNGGGTP